MANTIVRVRLVRPFGVVLGPERVEPLLLARARALRRLDGAPLHRPVHALVRAVLLRLTRVAALKRGCWSAIVSG